MLSRIVFPRKNKTQNSSNWYNTYSKNFKKPDNEIPYLSSYKEEIERYERFLDKKQFTPDDIYKYYVQEINEDRLYEMLGDVINMKKNIDIFIDLLNKINQTSSFIGSTKNILKEHMEYLIKKCISIYIIILIYFILLILLINTDNFKGITKNKNNNNIITFEEKVDGNEIKYVLNLKDLSLKINNLTTKSQQSKDLDILKRKRGYYINKFSIINIIESLIHTEFNLKNKEILNILNTYSRYIASIYYSIICVYEINKKQNKLTKLEISAKQYKDVWTGKTVINPEFTKLKNEIDNKVKNLNNKTKKSCNNIVSKISKQPNTSS